MTELSEKIGAKEDTLVILWTTGDRETALKMIFMYGFNSKTRLWWKNVHIIVWGSAAKLLAADEELKETVKKCMEAGVTFQACVTCAKLFGVEEELEKLGLEVIPMGIPFTEMIKSDYKILTI